MGFFLFFPYFYSLPPTVFGNITIYCKSDFQLSPFVERVDLWLQQFLWLAGYEVFQVERLKVGDVFKVAGLKFG